MNEAFISHKLPSAGFDFASGKRIEQKLIDYNQEAQRFGGIFKFLFFLCGSREREEAAEDNASEFLFRLCV